MEEEKEDVLSERENYRYCAMRLEEEEEDVLSKGGTEEVKEEKTLNKRENRSGKGENIE